jgi:hypothetical protein
VEATDNATVEWTPQAIGLAQSQDPDIGPIYNALKNDSEQPLLKEVISVSQATKIYHSQWASLRMLDGAMY